MVLFFLFNQKNEMTYVNALNMPAALDLGFSRAIGDHI
jgi:hypothetical protein